MFSARVSIKSAMVGTDSKSARGGRGSRMESAIVSESTGSAKMTPARSTRVGEGWEGMKGGELGLGENSGEEGGGGGGGGSGKRGTGGLGGLIL